MLRKNFQHIFPTKSAWDNTINIELKEGVEAQVLNPTYRLLHSILHSCIVDSNHRLGLVEIRQLHELARTQLIYGDQLDWDRLLVIARKNNIGGILSANLKEAEYFLNVPILKQPSQINPIAANFHIFRVCAKLRYAWFDYFDTKLSERIGQYFNEHASAMR